MSARVRRSRASWNFALSRRACPVCCPCPYPSVHTSPCLFVSLEMVTEAVSCVDSILEIREIFSSSVLPFMISRLLATVGLKRGMADRCHDCARNLLSRVNHVHRQADRILIDELRTIQILREGMVGRSGGCSGGRASGAENNFLVRRLTLSLITFPSHRYFNSIYFKLGVSQSTNMNWVMNIDGATTSVFKSRLALYLTPRIKRVKNRG